MERYSRVFFIDTENQGAMYLKDLSSLTNKDLVICMFTEFSPKFTYDQVGKFLESSAVFKFIDCLAGTPNSLDFQLSSMLGYYLRMEDEESESCKLTSKPYNPSEFIVLSQDTGYYGIVQFWSKQGYNVHIRNSLLGENIDVKAALENLTAKKAHLAMEVAANKAKLSGCENHATKKLLAEEQAKVNSAVAKFNSRLEKTKELNESKKVEKVTVELKAKPEVKEVKEVKAVKKLPPVSSLEKITELELDICEEVKVKEDECVEVKADVDDLSSTDITYENTTTNKYFTLLNTSNVGVVYKNIESSGLSLTVSDKVNFNTNKVSSFLKTSNFVSFVLGYIIYYSKNRTEMKEMLSRYASEEDVRVLIKRYGQKHFKNNFGLN